MNSINEQLQRLLQAAARAPRHLPDEAPLALQSKVLAHWRCGAADLPHLLVLPMLRRAAFCACLVMLLSLAFSYSAILNPENDEAIMANSAVDLTLLP